MKAKHHPDYDRLWRLVSGGVADFRTAHPDEIMPAIGNREASLVKRIVGQLVSGSVMVAFPAADKEDG